PFALVLSLSTPAAEVSRTPLPVYAAKIAPLLTPVDDVLPGRTAFPESKQGGIVLLSERIAYRDDDGTDYRVLHFIEHAVEQSGAESLGSETYSFDREREDIFLIEAATILPDGRRQPV